MGVSYYAVFTSVLKYQIFRENNSHFAAFNKNKTAMVTHIVEGATCHGNPTAVDLK